MTDLADVLSRAGASDENRTAWLLERAQGVTATEIRDLYMRRKSIPKLVAEKLAGPQPELNTPPIVYGREREADLVECIRVEYPEMKHESRVFHAADNSRYLGSPDALGEAVYAGTPLLAVGEVKTGKHNIRGGMPDYYGKGYHIQQQWCMRVTGARISLYVGEQHDSQWPDPQPLDLFPEVYVERYNPALVAELEVLADQFLAALDKATAGEQPEFDEVLDTHAVNYLRGLDLEKQGAVLKRDAFAAAKKALADEPTFSQASPLARITWTRAGEKTEQRPVEVVDVDAAKAAHPEEHAYLLAKRAEFEAIELAFDEAQEAWNQVLAEHTTQTHKPVTVTVRENLTITAPKTMKEKKK
jgi:hypothetical protein